ncbi:MAG: hypothetical protein K6F37_06580 [Lachnospiraceae bacterium]|nr:hypothetical protein [Lachnospiraceae bacterium]
MADEQYISKQKLDQIIQTQDRTVMDMSQIDMTKLSREEQRSIKNGESISAAEQEIAMIDRILTGEYQLDNKTLEVNQQIQQEDLTEEVIATLKHKKTLDQAHLLINNTMYEDSKEMTDVKNDVMKLITALEENMDKPMTPELMDNMEIAYSHATASCRYYLDNKNPTFKKGKLRKKMVGELFMSLLTEVTAFSCVRQAKDAEGKTFRELMQISGAGGEVQVRPAMKAKKVKTDKKAEQERANTTTMVKNLFGSGFDILQEINSAKKKGEKAAQFTELRRVLKLFAPDQVEVQDVNIMGKKVRLVQRSDNTLYVMQGDQEIPLELNAANLINKIERSMMDDAKDFGNQTIEELLDRYERDAPNAGEHTRVRTLLAAFLAKKTGLVENDFNNTFKSALASYARDIITGKKSAEQVKKEVEDNNTQNLYVNGVALSELVKINKNKSIDEIQKMVVLEKKKNEQVVPDGWTPEEQQIKNLLAELIFTADTSKMDESIQNPAKFMQEVLKEHSKALLTLTRGDQNIVTKVLDKMSLAEFATEGKANLAAVVEKSMNSIRDFMLSQLSRFDEKGDLAGTEGVTTDEEKLSFILKQNDNATRDALIGAKESLDAAVNETCDILQEHVSKMTDSIFPEQEEEKPMEGRKLSELIDESMYASKGFGKFVRTTLKKYFKGVSTMDKRAMISSVFRSAENVPEYIGEDKDIVEEMKALKLPKYANLFKKTGLYEKWELTEEDQQALEEYKANKRTLRKQANFFGGLLRGAGPLLQKMMQAMDRAPLPAEILKAIADMKSDLQPIPDDVVQTELLSMVQNSGGAVTKIEVVRSLGAASVGQTFMCKIYGPKMQDGRDVVIKLLRPDAKNRMQREEKIMLDCAGETSDAMYRTYLGQMNGFKAELDLSIEGKNCEEGVKYYDGKFEDIDTMRVFDGIPATNTSLVVEKAEGINCAKYIQELSAYNDELLGKFYGKTKHNGATTVHKRLTTNADRRDELLEVKAKLIEKIDEAVKRRDHLINLSNVWIDQATMKAGFFHGDLHGGNIMINDEKATFIDYGNTMKFTDKQRDNILKMLLAAQGSLKEKVSQNAVDLFFEAFDSLLMDNNDEDFLKTYTAEKKTELKDMFTKVLKLGEADEPGKRVYLALLKAQELGIKIPAEVQSFIEGQVRLQNTINNMNNAIDELKGSITNIDTAFAETTDTDCISLVQNRLSKQGKDDPKGFFERFVTDLVVVDKETFKKEMLDKTYVEEDQDEGIQEVNKREDFKNKYYKDLSGMNELTDEEKKMLGLVKYTDEEKSQGKKTYREQIEEFIAKYENKTDYDKEEYKKDFNKMATSCIPESAMDEDTMNYFGGYLTINNLLYASMDGLNKAKLLQVIDIYEKDLPQAYEMLKHMDDFFDNEDDLSEEEKQEKIDTIYKDYAASQLKKGKTSKVMGEFASKLVHYGIEENMEKELKNMFAEKTDGLGDILRAKFDAFKAVRAKIPPVIKQNIKNFVVPPELMAEYSKAESELMDAYLPVASLQLKRYYDKSFEKDPSVKFVNFDNVIIDVIQQNISGMWDALKFLNRLGTKAATVGMALRD